MSAQELTKSLMTELVAIQSGECIWCQRGKAHPHYSMCKHKNEFLPGAGSAPEFVTVVDIGRPDAIAASSVGFRMAGRM